MIESDIQLTDKSLWIYIFFIKSYEISCDDFYRACGHRHGDTGIDGGGAAGRLFPSILALKGFREALREKERSVVSRKELSEEKVEELDQVLQKIHPGDVVTVTYFDQGEYLETTGMIAKLDRDGRTIHLANVKIWVEDIGDIYIHAY